MRARARAFASVFSLFVACMALFAACNSDTAKPKSSAKQLFSFSFLAAGNPGLSADVKATINGDAVAATVPFGTDVTKLVATWNVSGDAVTVNGIAQLSGQTANDFTNPVVFNVIAEDVSAHAYTVTVTVAKSSAKEITSFEFADDINSALAATVTATINGTAIAATVPFGTNVSALVATFNTTGASVSVGSTAQVSGTTANNFASPVTYVVTAADGSTQNYTVTVTIAPSSAKAITAFDFLSAKNSSLSTDVTANINNFAIAATVPFGTNVTALVATFSTTGASVKVGNTAQVSGTTANNFTNPVAYVVTAADGTTATFTVTVSIAANPAKAITSFAFLSAKNPGVLATDVTGNINGFSIAATLPPDTSPANLIATFATTGASVTVGGVLQVSGVTANDFTNPVTYVVTAADGTTQDYTVTVTVALSDAKALSDYKFLSVNNPGVLPADVTATLDGTTFSATVPAGTIITALIANFATTGATVTVGGVPQVSGQTANDFTNPVDYLVTAEDGTTATFTVKVTVAASDAKDITAFSFLAKDNSAVLHTDVIATVSLTDHTITAILPPDTSPANLIAEFATSGATVSVGGVAQTSGQTANDFSKPVVYTVTAADGTTQTFTVTVTVALSDAKAITSFSFLTANNPGLGNVTGVIDQNGLTIAATVPFGTDITALVATFATTGVSVTVNGTAQISDQTANDFTAPVAYVVTAEDGTLATYAVTVTIAPAPKSIDTFAFLAANNGGTGGLTADAIGVINGNSIIVAVPTGTKVTALKATFTFTGTSVAVGAIAQVNSTTANDFTNPVVYTVTGADNLTKDFTVTVFTPADLTAFSFTTASTLLAGNPVGTTNATINGTSIEIGVAPGTVVTALAATFTKSLGSTVTVNGVPQVSAVGTSPGTPNDFTDPVVYTVTAPDGTTKVFTVTVTVDLVSFSFTGNLGSELTATSDGTTPELASAPVMSRMGGAPTATGNVFTGTGWNATAVDPNHFYAFTVTPAAGHTLTLTELDLKDQASGTGPKTFVVRTSLDNFTANVATFTTHALLGLDAVTLGSGFANLTTPVTFELLAFGGTAAAGTWRVDDVQVIGTGTP